MLKFNGKKSKKGEHGREPGTFQPAANALQLSYLPRKTFNIVHV